MKINAKFIGINITIVFRIIIKTKNNDHEKSVEPILKKVTKILFQKLLSFDYCI